MQIANLVIRVFTTPKKALQVMPPVLLVHVEDTMQISVNLLFMRAINVTQVLLEKNQQHLLKLFANPVAQGRTIQKWVVIHR